ncbi:MAG: endolytic transglycosylase MltG, partial [Bacteroidales bacterium]|nr:endolytic transglycosylase MltG [Bacteroidales bacterium]
TSQTFIGMFIPNTYELYWTASPESVIKRMHQEYKAFWNESRIAKGKNMGMSKNEIMTLASIVNEETNNIGEMPKIAGVYINRLKKGMPLQACPTVIYAHLDSEPGIKRVLKRHLKIDSPYNTYKNKGLPPGPITIPTIKAIDAVLNYEKSNYIYFCAKPEFDGTHNFASTYSQHQKNAKAYQKALSAKK